MKIHILISLIILLLFTSCGDQAHKTQIIPLMNEKIYLDLNQAFKLSLLPLKCIDNRLPYKSDLTLTSDDDLRMPYEHHPAFYGCFDWHSAVHGHWSLVYLLKTFPELENRAQIREKLHQNLTKDHLEKELAYFGMNQYTKTFERTYGWAWILKLYEELITWNDPDGQKWAENLRPLAQLFSASYIEYLPNLVYPIRVGEHSNTAFGLSFAYDYALAVQDEQLKAAITENALRFYSNDKNCPIDWEPSGYDFLSPCLQEIDIMLKILNGEEFEQWLDQFMPELKRLDFSLVPGKIKDRSDGKMVHLDGLNFSRAWCLYQLNKYQKTRQVANEHMAYSLEKITDGNYAGEHWLASFALYAFKINSESQNVSIN